MAHVPRIHWPQALQADQQLELSGERAHHLLRVLKRKAGDPLCLFQDQGEWSARITATGKTVLQVQIEAFSPRASESPLNTRLVQAISRGDKMEFTIQKAVELGVQAIQPVLSERGGVQLDGKRLDKKQQHWQAVAQSAAEQCGRLRIPPVLPVRPLRSILGSAGLQGLVMDPHGGRLDELQPKPDQPLDILIGPEAGLSQAEMRDASSAGLQRVRLGPRVLRTETAGLVALSALQWCWGDFQSASNC